MSACLHNQALSCHRMALQDCRACQTPKAFVHFRAVHRASCLYSRAEEAAAAEASGGIICQVTVCVYTRINVAQHCAHEFMCWYACIRQTSSALTHCKRCAVALLHGGRFVLVESEFHSFIDVYVPNRCAQHCLWLRCKAQVLYQACWQKLSIL